MSTRGVLHAIEEAAVKADDLARRKRDAGFDVARHRAAGRAEGLREAARIVAASADVAYVVPTERTPETVLRAMCAAYMLAAVDAEAVIFRALRGSTKLQQLRAIKAWDAAANMRAATATYFAEGQILPWLTLHTDYEARLSGQRPLDAPPMEEP